MDLIPKYINLFSGQEYQICFVSISSMKHEEDCIKAFQLKSIQISRRRGLQKLWHHNITCLVMLLSLDQEL